MLAIMVTQYAILKLKLEIQFRMENASHKRSSIKSADIFPKMRSLTDEDLFAMAGHILIQPKVVNEKWGGGKIYY